MGNSNPEVTPINYDGLVKVEGKSNLFYDVMKDKSAYDLQYQLYQFPILKDRQLVQELEDYNKRSELGKRSQVRSHVKVFGIEAEKQPFGFGGHKTMLKVLTQRVPYQLTDISGNLDLKDAQILLYNVLRGFQELQRHFGNVIVNSHKIGFTFSGQIKCWTQANFGMNYSSHKSVSQRQMIHSIFNSIVSRTEQSAFRDSLGPDGKCRFEHIGAAIDYARSLNIAHPNELEEGKIHQIGAKIEKARRETQMSSEIRQAPQSAFVRPPAPMHSQLHSPMMGNKVDFSYKPTSSLLAR